MHMCICMYIWLCVHGCVYTYMWMYTGVFSFDLSILMFLFCFFSRLPFSLIFVLTWGTTMTIRHFCPFCAIPAIADAIHILSAVILSLQLLYFNFLTSLCFVCFSFIIIIFVLLRLIFRFNKFVIFQFLYSCLWFVFMAK